MGRVYLTYYNNNLVCIVQVLRSSDYHFDTRIILAAAAIPIPDPASVDETEAIPDANQPTQQPSTEDEDLNEEVVNDVDVIAEVKLSSTVRKFDLFTITFPSPCY
jgi:UDP-glucose 4-epimerase